MLVGSGLYFIAVGIVCVLLAKELNANVRWMEAQLSNVRYGTLALLAGTFSVTALAMVLAVPFGLGAAIFVSEFCGTKLKETLKGLVE